MILKIVYFLVAVFFFWIGLSSLIKGTVQGSYQQYTEESLKKYSRPFGICYMISGVCAGIGGYFNLYPENTTYHTLCIVFVAATLVFILVAYFLQKKTLVLKEKEPIEVQAVEISDDGDAENAEVISAEPIEEIHAEISAESPETAAEIPAEIASETEDNKQE